MTCSDCPHLSGVTYRGDVPYHVRCVFADGVVLTHPSRCPLTETRHRNLRDKVVGRLGGGRPVDELTLRNLFGQVADCITHGSVTDAMSSMEREMCGRSVGSMESPDFSLGACWGALEVLRACLEGR